MHLGCVRQLSQGGRGGGGLQGSFLHLPLPLDVFFLLVALFLLPSDFVFCVFFSVVPDLLMPTLGPELVTLLLPLPLLPLVLLGCWCWWYSCCYWLSWCYHR